MKFLFVAPHAGGGGQFDGPWCGPVLLAIIVVLVVSGAAFLLFWLTEGGQSRLKSRFRRRWRKEKPCHLQSAASFAVGKCEARIRALEARVAALEIWKQKERP